jgi:phospholipid-transporting ATPase
VAHVSAEKKASAEILFRDFTSLLFAAQAVVGCRVTPREKQIFVALVKEHKPGAITLAIGDGANDVAMITEAHVGVGILGVEGREAAKASDFAIPEFRHLRRLLFYCGQECYRRNSEVILYNFYKNINVRFPVFWFGIWSDFSGEFMLNAIILVFYNLIMTSLPIIIFALFDELYPAHEQLTLVQKLPN